MAIVTVLPAANLASPLIAIFKYHTPDGRRFINIYMPYEEKFEVLYDLVLTTPGRCDSVRCDRRSPDRHLCVLHQSKAECKARGGRFK